MGDFCSKLDSTVSSIREWAKRDFGDIFKEKKILMARLGGIQKALDDRPNPFLNNLGYELQLNLEEALRREELLWM